VRNSKKVKNWSISLDFRENRWLECGSGRHTTKLIDNFGKEIFG